ncbi:MAG: VTT domain-containing protein [Candidatus Moranbacteria bacterium]|nr:VTT domain-containing protein [Candidatus Moranbacteria bacterium]
MAYTVPVRSWIRLIAALAVFIVLSYAAQTHVDTLARMVGEGWFGKLSYVAMTIIATVIAPVSSVPLIAAASGLWGWVMGALLSILGWFIGAAIAFELSRSYGRKRILESLNDQSKAALQRIIPQRYGFVGLILLRMSVPVDVLSYALGLFSSVDRKTYYISTAIGIIPFAFVFAYFGMIDYRWQIAVFILAVVAIWCHNRTRNEG